MNKFEILIDVLDSICKDAPKNYKTYHPDKNSIEQVMKARSLAYVHLFLNVRFGLVNFNDQFNYMTEGGYDGGIDAYYIDKANKKLFLIQSKFGETKKNFEEKRANADELIKMDIKRILEGELTDGENNPFNSKIQNFQNKWSKVEDSTDYETIVILLCNLKTYSKTKLSRLIQNEKYEIVDYAAAYSTLLFPLCTSTYYNKNPLLVTINVEEKDPSHLEQKIDTSSGKLKMDIVFAPTAEMAMMMSKYKNYILKYNPRNYLSLSKNDVNKKINSSIMADNTNDFAILNNGITIICDSVKYDPHCGVRKKAKVKMINPQIVNGGQTAYTLSAIYEKNKDDYKSIFEKKEVMLKIIELPPNRDHKSFIEQISDATNQQTKVEEADRRSNDPKQIELQEILFKNYDLFYERKKGEFYSGLTNKFIRPDSIIKRELFLRSYLAFCGNPSDARRSGSDSLFKEKKFKKILGSTKKINKMLCAYLLLMKIRKTRNIKKNSRTGGIRYSRFAMVAAAGRMLIGKKITIKNMHKRVDATATIVTKRWKKFESYAKKLKKNKQYYAAGGYDFDNYYKGKTINLDIKNFFQINHK